MFSRSARTDAADALRRRRDRSVGARGPRIVALALVTLLTALGLLACASVPDASRAATGDVARKSRTLRTVDALRLFPSAPVHAVFRQADQAPPESDLDALEPEALEKHYAVLAARTAILTVHTPFLLALSAKLGRGTEAPWATDISVCSALPRGPPSPAI